MGAGVRVLHQADIGALPLAGIPGWCGGDRGRRGMTSGGCPRYSRRALAVQWEQWVPTNVSLDSFHAGHLNCSKNCVYLEPRYGIEP
jgi:hypothetical protein